MVDGKIEIEQMQEFGFTLSKRLLATKFGSSAQRLCKTLSVDAFKVLMTMRIPNSNCASVREVTPASKPSKHSVLKKRMESV